MTAIIRGAEKTSPKSRVQLITPKAVPVDEKTRGHFPFNNTPGSDNYLVCEGFKSHQGRYIRQEFVKERRESEVLKSRDEGDMTE